LGSVYGLINLSFFIVLATLLCAIIAFQLFEGVINELDDESEMRFFSVYNSFVSLYQVSFLKNRNRKNIKQLFSYFLVKIGQQFCIM
jgi:hypothetical protein